MIPDRWILTTMRANREGCARATGLSVRATELTGHTLNGRGELCDRHPELLNPEAELSSTVGIAVVPGPYTWKGFLYPAVFWEHMEAVA